MIYDCLIAPSENPTSLLEIKRALLTYDKINLIDPNDRDLIPPETYTSIITGVSPFFFGANGGPIRPMGKSFGYDSIFEKIIEQCKPAIQEGLITTIQTYKPKPKTSGATIHIFSDVTGGYPLDVGDVFHLYREIASSQDFLNAAIIKTQGDLLKNQENFTDLIARGLGDYPIPNLNRPGLPKIKINTHLSDQDIDFLTTIARARIAAVVKYSGYCDHKNIIPIFSGDIYGGIISSLLQNSQSLLSSIGDCDFWTKRNRILELCHEEHLDNEALEKMPLEHVIKLRTSAWGKQAKAREDLFESIRTIALEEESDELFKKESKKLISKYTRESENIMTERKAIKFKINCEIGKALLGIPGAAGAIFSQIGSPSASIGLALAAGGVWCFDKAKDYIPTLNELTERERKERKGAGFAINNFYSRINKN